MTTILVIVLLLLLLLLILLLLLVVVVVVVVVVVIVTLHLCTLLFSHNKYILTRTRCITGFESCCETTSLRFP